MKKILILIVILAAVIILGMVSGSVKIPLSDLFLQENRAIIFLRFLRIFTAVIAGAGLAVSGVVLQAILRNSLAEPYLLGTSSGAGLGAALSIIMGVSAVFLPVAGFRIFFMAVLIESYFRHTLPCIFNITCSAPAISSDFTSPN